MLAAGVDVLNENEDIGLEGEAVEAVKFLLEKGADPHAVNNNGENAMHGAIGYRGWLQVARLLREKKVREGFAQLAPLGLSFDAWVYHPQLGDVIDLARAFPGTQIVLNHVGGPIGLGRYKGKRDEVFADWSGRIRELAACPNVHVKLGGLGMKMFGFDVHEGEIAPGSEQLAGLWRPYVETCIDAFGTKRAMFESNFPVDKIACAYVPLWNSFKKMAARYSGSERDALLRETAARVYRLDLPALLARA